jgi:hypothetical protein
MVRKRSKTPNKIERKQKYLLKKYYTLQEKIHNNNLNLYVNVTDENILKETSIDKLDSIKTQLLFLIRLANMYLE